MATCIVVLQWGRDQLIAEIELRWAELRGADLLQWGRDQLIAEIPGVHRLAQAADRFNGAAIS